MKRILSSRFYGHAWHAPRLPLAEARFLWKVAGLCAGVVLVLAAGVAVYLHARQAQVRAAAHEQLVAIADLKLNQIRAWREERLADARFFSRARFAARETQLFLQDASPTSRAAVMDWLNLLKGENRYYDVLVFDASGRRRLAVPENASDAAGAEQEWLGTARRAPAIAMSDLLQETPGGTIHMDLVFPLFEQADCTRPVLSFVLLRLDARHFLFPIVQSWPTPSRTAETVLVQRRGDRVLFLNDPRSQPGVAMRLRLPVTNSLFAAAFGLGSDRRPYEEVDYRGVPVVASARRVPGTDWIMVAKIDRQELYAPLRRETLVAALALGLVLLAGTLAIALVWRRRNTRFLHRELALQQERTAATERLAQVMRNANDMILVLDADGRIVEANASAIARYGWGEAEFIGMPATALRAPDAREDLAADTRRLDEQGLALYETLHRRRDGHVFPVEISSSRLVVGGQICLLAIVRDITDRRRAEQDRDRLVSELEAERSRWRGVVEGIVEEVWLCDLRGRMTLINLPGLTQLDLARLDEQHIEALYRDAEILDADGRPRPPDQAPLLQALTGRVVRGEEIMIRRPSGQRRYRQFSAAPTRDAAGAITGSVAVVRDITEQHEDQEALRRAKEEWERTFDCVPDLIAILDDQRRIRRVNRALAGRLKLAPEACEGQFCCRVLHGTDRQPAVCPHALTLVDGRQHTAELHEARLGGDFLVSATPLRDADGRVFGSVHVARDITDRKRAEEEIRRLNADLERRVAQRTAELTLANAELEAFTHSVSHDLRAPLRHVAAFLEPLREAFGPRAPAKVAGPMADIAHEIARMTRLIDDLLAFARSGTVELRKQQVALRPLVEEIVAGFAPDLAGRQVTWRIGSLPEVIADPALLRQALSNLVDNALKFTQTQAAAIVEIGSRVEPHEWVVHVRDNGVGFDPAQAGRLFGAFQRLHSQSQFTGTGVGLANVQRIIRRHGGRVWAEGAEGRGATFFIALPRPASEPSAPDNGKASA